MINNRQTYQPVNSVSSEIEDPNNATQFRRIITQEVDGANAKMSQWLSIYLIAIVMVLVALAAISVFFLMFVAATPFKTSIITNPTLPARQTIVSASNIGIENTIANNQLVNESNAIVELGSFTYVNNVLISKQRNAYPRLTACSRRDANGTLDTTNTCWFLETSLNNSAVLAMYIAPNGFIALGHTDPQEQLDIALNLKLRGSLTIGDPTIFTSTPVEGLRIYAQKYVNTTVAYNVTTGNVTITQYRNQNVTISTLSLQLDPDGNLIISGNLHVNGTFTANTVIVTQQTIDNVVVNGTADVSGFATFHAGILVFGGLTSYNATITNLYTTNIFNSDLIDTRRLSSLNATITYLNSQYIFNSDLITTNRLYVTGITQFASTLNVVSISGTGNIVMSGFGTFNNGFAVNGAMTSINAGLTIGGGGFYVNTGSQFNGGVTFTTGGMFVNTGATFTEGVTISGVGYYVNTGSQFNAGVTFTTGGVFVDTATTFTAGVRVGPTGAGPGGNNVHIIGNLEVDGTFSNPSSQEIKQNITDIDAEVARNVVMSIVPRTYFYKQEYLLAHNITQLLPKSGFIAEQVANATTGFTNIVRLSNILTAVNTTTLLPTLAKDEMIPFLWAHIRNITAEFDALKLAFNAYVIAHP